MDTRVEDTVANVLVVLDDFDLHALVPYSAGAGVFFEDLGVKLGRLGGRPVAAVAATGGGLEVAVQA
jgi:hypothetical protein